MPIVNREKERQIVKEAIRQGKDEAFIRSAIERFRSQAQQEAKPEETQKEPGFLQGLLQSLAKPALRVAATGARAFTGGGEEPVGFGFLGKAKPLPPVIKEGGLISKEGKLQQPFNLKGLAQSVGVGSEIAGTIFGGGAAKKVGIAGLKGLGVQAIKQGFFQGAKGGALIGAGSQLAEEGEVGKETVKAGLAGGAGGGFLGGLLGFGSGVVGKVAKTALRKTKGLKIFDKTRTKVLLDDAVDIVSSKVKTVKEKTRALVAGLGEKAGLTGKKVTFKPSKRDISLAKSVVGLVRKGANVVDNIKSIGGEVSKITLNLKSFIKKNDAIFNTNQLKSVLKKAKEKSRVIFGTDKTLESRYDSVIDEIFRNIKKKNLSGLFEGRIKFDQIVKRKFPRVFDGSPGDNVTKNAVLDVRRAVNKFVGQHLPKNNQFLELLEREHLMLEAIENIAEKAAQTEGAGAINTLLKAIGFGALGAAGGFGASAVFGGGGGR